MEDLILYIVKSMVKNPDAVKIESSVEDGTEIYNLTVDEEDKGFVIGRHGKVAKAIRALVKAVADQQGKTVRIYIL